MAETFEIDRTLKPSDKSADSSQEARDELPVETPNEDEEGVGFGDVKDQGEGPAIPQAVIRGILADWGMF